jgi:hypothetical protein
MPLLTIVVNVDADSVLTDPHDVADALGIDSDQEIFGVAVNGRAVEVNFVSAEWS